MPDINLSPYTVQSAQIEQRRRMAELLSQQSMQPMDTNQMAGGYVVPVSPFAGLAKMLQGYAGGVGQRKASEEMLALSQRQQDDRNADMQAFAKALAGTPGTPEKWSGEAGTGDELFTPASPGRPAGQIDPQTVAQLRDPQIQSMALALLGKQGESYNLRPGEVRMQGGNVVAKNDVPDEVVWRDVGDKQVPVMKKTGMPAPNLQPLPISVSPNTVYSDAGATARHMTPEGFRMDQNGQLFIEPGFLAGKSAIAAAGRPSMNSTVINSGPKAFENEMGKSDAEQVGQWRKEAMAANNALQSVQNMRDSIQKGAFTGGGAQVKTDAANLISGLTGIEFKKLAGSQEFNAEASKLVLQHVKELGANPSNTDREFIEKTIPRLASSPEARDQLIKWVEQQAKRSIDRYQRGDAYARQNSGLRGFNIIQPIQGNKDGVPQGVDPALWGAMTDQEKSLWRK